MFAYSRFFNVDVMATCRCGNQANYVLHACSEAWQRYYSWFRRTISESLNKLIMKERWLMWNQFYTRLCNFSVRDNRKSREKNDILRAKNVVPRIINPTEFSWDRISGSAPRGGEIYGSRLACLLLSFVFSSLAARTSQTLDPVSMHHSSKYAVWRKKKDPLTKCFPKFWLWGVIFPEDQANFVSSRGIPAKMK